MTDSSVGTILNVNDDEASLHANSRVLTSAGYRVIVARTGKDALRAAVGEQPALILLDAQLPDIPGAEVCRLLKSDPHVKPVATRRHEDSKEEPMGI